MASFSSSSSSSSDSRYIYDVFINFRGEDTRKSFVSHLYAAFSNAGINAFNDVEPLLKGTEVEAELLRAIENSRISIVVFSTNFAGSIWCLNELEKIMQCRENHGQVVIPVFYDVDPSDVRRQQGAFGETLQQTAKSRKLGENVLSRWRTALIEATSLSGWHLGNSRSEAEVVQRLVEDLLRMLKRTMNITQYPVGLDTRVQQVIQFIENQFTKVSLIGLWGMGGSGKTTTAKAIYNQIHGNFVNRSFIGNVRQICQKENSGIIHLQQQLLSDILNTKETIGSIEEGEMMINRRFQGKRVLVVLDDVTTFEQLELLCRNPNLFGPGSVLIVTTRDAHLLKLVKVDYVCTMKEMDEKESLELFSWHAFKHHSPMEKFSELARKTVAYCGGLPLALEVIGSYLYKRSKEEWKNELLKLERIPNDQVHRVLRISYDSLNYDMEKDIFLDICCFFIGMDRAYVTEILNGCGLYADIGIAVLIDRSLL
ncbi:putative disease resistance protein (TIR-NBS-LRR class), partial [Trifolium pratense]